MRFVVALCWFAVVSGCIAPVKSIIPDPIRMVPVGMGWAQSSVNTSVFRKNSLVTRENKQFVAWYDPDGYVVLAKRALGSNQWETRRTTYRGNVRDAHNAISIGIDGRGVLHVAWDHHGQPLNYAQGRAPGSLELTERLPMTGLREDNVTYPEFYSLANGDLLFMYRDGSSGKGDVMLDRFDVRTGTWNAVAHPLIDGEGERNAYPNLMAIDSKGGWHLSWVWRETPDVATNHDIAYMYSTDEGHTWKRSDGTPYVLPVTAGTAETAWRVPEGSDLINQTSMTVDAGGRPVIATYWRPNGDTTPQYQVVWYDGNVWQNRTIGRRKTPFSLNGTGTRRIPLSRPLLLARSTGGLYLIFRDDERGGGVSVACADGLDDSTWEIRDLTDEPLGAWEPTNDPERWNRTGTVHLFYQAAGQGDGETLENLPPQPISVLEWEP